jgi:MazG family protein
MDNAHRPGGNPAATIEKLLTVMAQLRSPVGGCPWDLQQDFASIAPYTIEEAYEVADAIERKDMAALKSELGDLLLQVVFHARMAEEAGLFNFGDVVNAITNKMVTRHPHVFGEKEIESATEQTKAWEEQKEKERHEQAAATGGKHRVLDGVAGNLPALMRALKLQQRAARVGFDWSSLSGVYEKIDEELSELKAEILEDTSRGSNRLREEFGDLMFAMVNLARHLDVDPDRALRHGNAKFERRFRWMEQSLNNEGRSFADVSLAQMESLWQRAKTETETAAGFTGEQADRAAT